MKRTIFILIVSLIVGQTALSMSARGQAKRQVQQDLRKVEADNDRLKRELKNLKSDLSDKLDASNSKIDALNSKIETSDQKVRDLNEQLGNRISSTEGSTDQKLNTIENYITKNIVILAIGGLVLAAFTGLVYFFLRRRITRDKTDLADKITRTRAALEEEGVKLDNKLIEVLSSKMEGSTASGDPIRSGDPEPDHSLALKVADEIVRIEKNLNVIDPEIRGLKQLAASVGRIRDSFAAKGYELVEMLNRPYDPGMKVIANFRPDENLKQDEQIITRIIKPQVNYGGVMIQAAQIEVSQGE